jgi:hypothetical protein
MTEAETIRELIELVNNRDWQTAHATLGELLEKQAETQYPDAYHEWEGTGPYSLSFVHHLLTPINHRGEEYDLEAMRSRIEEVEDGWEFADHMEELAERWHAAHETALRGFYTGEPIRLTIKRKIEEGITSGRELRLMGEALKDAIDLYRPVVATFQKISMELYEAMEKRGYLQGW